MLNYSRKLCKCKPNLFSLFFSVSVISRFNMLNVVSCKIGTERKYFQFLLEEVIVRQQLKAVISSSFVPSSTLTLHCLLLTNYRHCPSVDNRFPDEARCQVLGDSRIVFIPLRGLLLPDTNGEQKRQGCSLHSRIHWSKLASSDPSALIRERWIRRNLWLLYTTSSSNCYSK